jgi:hypothetical protein
MGQFLTRPIFLTSNFEPAKSASNKPPHQVHGRPLAALFEARFRAKGIVEVRID